MAWILVPSLVSLRAEFNALAASRDRASDGAIGDGEHSQNSSDHNPDETGRTPTEDADSTNEVHAIDVDADLRRSGWSMTKAVEIVVVRHRDGRDDRLQNVIWNRRIWSRSWGWTARTYTGVNGHTHHAHFSARYTTAAETDTRPWGLLAAAELEDDVSQADVIAALQSTAGKAALVAALTTDAGGTALRGSALLGVYDALTRGAARTDPTGRQIGDALQNIIGADDLHTKADALDALVRQLGDYVQRLASDELARDQADATRDAELPAKVREALGAGQSPEQVAALLRPILGGNAAAVGLALQQ